MPTSDTAPRALGVSEAMSLAKGALETVRVRVTGEVTGATDKPGYKAVYFSLKDECSVMPCLIWRDAYEASGTRLADGQLVEVTGSFTAYAPKGRLQFQVRTMVAAGEGALRLQVAELARRLEAEGLMDPSRKRPLPAYPKRVGLVTSPRGKAVHDVLRTLKRRYPAAEVVVAGVAVEGASAVSEIVRGLAAVAEAPGVDVVVLARGGGSYEDLMPFSSEEVARAVADCPVPVVTGIGHEPDTSIADMVSDVRASTPTAAAEAVSPDAAEVARRLTALKRLLARSLGARVAAAGHRLSLLAARPAFCDPRALLGTSLQSVDGLSSALERALPERLARQHEAVARASEALGRVGRRIGVRERVMLAVTRERALAVGRSVVERASHVVAGSAARLHDLSPVGILGRGYAVCYEEGGAVLRTADDVAEGDRVRVRLARGILGCLVEHTEIGE